MINEINSLLETYDSAKFRTKAVLEKFFASKNYELTDRWNVFMNTPSELKNRSCWVEHFYSVDLETILEWRERYQVITVGEIVEHLEEDLELDVETVNKFKEEVLSRNFWSYTYDW